MVKYSQTTEKKGSVEMKGIRAAVLALGGAFLLAGCGGESGVLASIPAEGFSQGVYDALEENWTAWEAVDELERMLSSTLPGHCAQEFDSWAQCADFLGPSIPDPAADCGWRQQAPVFTQAVQCCGWNAELTVCFICAARPPVIIRAVHGRIAAWVRCSLRRRAQSLRRTRCSCPL